MKNILYDPIYSMLWGNSQYVKNIDNNKFIAYFYYQYAETLNLDDTIYLLEDLNYFYKKFKLIINSLTKNIVVYYELPMFIE